MCHVIQNNEQAKKIAGSIVLGEEEQGLSDRGLR